MTFLDEISNAVEPRSGINIFNLIDSILIETGLKRLLMPNSAHYIPSSRTLEVSFGVFLPALPESDIRERILGNRDELKSFFKPEVNGSKITATINSLTENFGVILAQVSFKIGEDE